MSLCCTPPKTNECPQVLLIFAVCQHTDLDLPKIVRYQYTSSQNAGFLVIDNSSKKQRH